MVHINIKNIKAYMFSQFYMHSTIDWILNIPLKACVMKSRSPLLGLEKRNLLGG